MKELYSWGDIGRDAYTSERDEITAKLRAVVPAERQRVDLEKLAGLLRSASALWSARDGTGKHDLITQLVDRIIIRDDQIEAIVPRLDASAWLPTWHG